MNSKLLTEKALSISFRTDFVRYTSSLVFVLKMITIVTFADCISYSTAVVFIVHPVFAACFPVKILKERNLFL